MTLEEMRKDEQYEVEVRAEKAARPKSKSILLAAAVDASLYAPIKDTVHTTNIETPIVTTITGNNYYENIPNEPTIITTVNAI